MHPDYIYCTRYIVASKLAIARKRISVFAAFLTLSNGTEQKADTWTISTIYELGTCRYDVPPFEDSLLMKMFLIVLR